MEATVLDLNGEKFIFRGVQRVSWVNQDSYGPGKPVSPGRETDSDRVESGTLVVNVNGFAAAKFE